MQAFLKQLEQLKNWKQLLREACKKNRISTSSAEQMTPKKLKTLNEWFIKVHKNNLRLDSWVEHQKEAFTWVLIAFSAMKNVIVADFGEQEWGTLYKIFQNKSQNFLRYEARRFLLQKAPNSRHWAESEEQLLSLLIKEHQQQKRQEKGKWYRIARQLFQRSEGRYFRNSKQCRERWSNYLDPTKVRGNWTAEQELTLLQKVEQKGKRWAELAHLMNRNQHSVKNRYNSIINQQRKITPSIRKQQKLLLEAKKKLQKSPPPQLIPQIVVQPVPEPPKQDNIIQPSKFRVKFKYSGQSLFDDNRSSVNFNNEFEAKNRLDFPYCVQGEQYVKHLLKEEQQHQKHQPSYQNSFLWSICSPQFTPLGLSPSPMNFSYAIGQTNNFYRGMQNWGRNQKQQPFK